jgi:hypothetical protein
MTINSTDPRQELLHLISDDSAHPFLTLAWRTTTPDYRVELVELEQGVGNAFLAYARRAAESLTQRTLIPYDPEWLLRDHEYFLLSPEEFPSTNLFDDLGDFHNLATFKRKNLTKPRLYILAIQIQGGVALFGKRMAYLQVLKQKPGVFAAVWDGSTFNALSESIATFSQTFDWLTWRQNLYVLDGSGFHGEFRDGASLMNAVAGQVTAISAKVGIINIDAMIARCQSSVPMASKLKRISEHGLHLTSTPAELKDYAQTYGLDVQWQDNKLVFDGSLEGQWKILKLLDEDRTEGPVTHRHYESAAKREI